MVKYFATMTSIAPMLLVYLAGFFLASVSASICKLYPLYQHGADHGDTVVTEGENTCTYVDLGHTFNFYGKEYNDVYISDNGLISFGKCYRRASTDFGPKDVPYAAAFWADIDLSRSGYAGGLLYRKVNLTEEPEMIAQVEQDSTALGESITPEMVVVITWKEVREPGRFLDRNNFQIVLASEGNKTITIYNYGFMQWLPQYSNGAVVFNKGDRHTWNLYWITGKYSEMRAIDGYSTIGFPGRIATRVDGDIQLPELTKTNCNPCEGNSLTGSIKTFDGKATNVLNGADRKYLVAKSYQGDEDGQLDQCKFMLKATTNSDGKVEYVSFSVGVHPKKQTKYKRSFIFERKGKRVVEAAGHGLKKVITQFPYYEFIEDNGQKLSIILERNYGGWRVRSPICQYNLAYTPSIHGEEVNMYVGPYFRGKTFGLCQNCNGTASDDDKKCTVPPEVGTEAEIIESCSCLITEKSCCKALNVI